MKRRLFDIITASFLLFLSLPLFLVIILLIKIDLKSPVFFVQQRLGKNKKLFPLIKFRTIASIEEHRFQRQQISCIGKILRKTSLDELPQLWNVICGQMSLIGPRPLIAEEGLLCPLQCDKRYDIKPGMTGWAQVNGRNTISWDKKFALDAWYVDNRSLWLDCKILLLTLIKVALFEGVNPIPPQKEWCYWSKK